MNVIAKSLTPRFFLRQSIWNRFYSTQMQHSKNKQTPAKSDMLLHCW